MKAVIRELIDLVAAVGLSSLFIWLFGPFPLWGSMIIGVAAILVVIPVSAYLEGLLGFSTSDEEYYDD